MRGTGAQRCHYSPPAPRVWSWGRAGGWRGGTGRRWAGPRAAPESNASRATSAGQNPAGVYCGRREPPRAGTHTPAPALIGKRARAPQALCTPEPAAEGPVRLRAAAPLPGAPLYHWFLPARTTLPFTLEGARCAQVIDQGSWARRMQLGTPGAPVCGAVKKLVREPGWRRGLERLQVRSGAAGNFQPNRTPQGPRRIPSRTSQGEESGRLDDSASLQGVESRKKSLVPKSSRWSIGSRATRDELGTEDPVCLQEGG